MTIDYRPSACYPPGTASKDCRAHGGAGTAPSGEASQVEGLLPDFFELEKEPEAVGRKKRPLKRKGGKGDHTTTPRSNPYKKGRASPPAGKDAVSRQDAQAALLATYKRVGLEGAIAPHRACVCTVLAIRAQLGPPIELRAVDSMSFLKSGTACDLKMFLLRSSAEFVACR